MFVYSYTRTHTRTHAHTHAHTHTSVSLSVYLFVYLQCTVAFQAEIEQGVMKLVEWLQKRVHTPSLFLTHIHIYQCALSHTLKQTSIYVSAYSFTRNVHINQVASQEEIEKGGTKLVEWLQKHAGWVGPLRVSTVKRGDLSIRGLVATVQFFGWLNMCAHVYTYK